MNQVEEEEEGLFKVSWDIYSRRLSIVIVIHVGFKRVAYGSW